MLTVQEPPDKNTEEIKADCNVLLRMEKQTPVVKLLPEYDKRVGYELVTVVHGGTLSFHSLSLRTGQY